MGVFNWLSGLFGAGESHARTTNPDVSQNSDALGESTGYKQGEPPTPLATSLVDLAADAGYELDYSPQSLGTVDEFLEDIDPETEAELARPMVAYLGEVFVRSYGAEWTLIEDSGWYVDLAPATDRDEENVFAIPNATHAVMEGEETFASVHDQTAAGLDTDAPTLSDGPVGGGGGPEGDPADDATRAELRAEAESLVEDWPEYTLDFSSASLAAVDDLIAEKYDMTDEDVDREERLSQGPIGGVPEGARLTIGTGGATSQLGAYIGEVYRREYDAQWHSGTRPTIAIQTGKGTLEFEPEYMVNAAYHGWISFANFHDMLDDEHELSGTA